MHPFSELTNRTPSPSQKDEGLQARKHSPWTAARHKKKTRSVGQPQSLIDALPTYQQPIPECFDSPARPKGPSPDDGAGAEYPLGGGGGGGEGSAASSPLHASCLPPVSQPYGAGQLPCKASSMGDPQGTTCSPAKQQQQQGQHSHSPGCAMMDAEGGSSPAGIVFVVPAGQGPHSPVLCSAAQQEEEEQQQHYQDDMGANGSRGGSSRLLHHSSSAPACNNLFERFGAVAGQLQQQLSQQLSQQLWQQQQQEQHKHDRAHYQGQLWQHKQQGSQVYAPAAPAADAGDGGRGSSGSSRRGLVARRRSWQGYEPTNSSSLGSGAGHAPVHGGCESSRLPQWQQHRSGDGSILAGALPLPCNSSGGHIGSSGAQCTWQQQQQQQHFTLGSRIDAAAAGVAQCGRDNVSQQQSSLEAGLTGRDAGSRLPYTRHFCGSSSGGYCGSDDSSSFLCRVPGWQQADDADEDVCEDYNISRCGVAAYGSSSAAAAASAGVGSWGRLCGSGSTAGGAAAAGLREDVFESRMMLSSTSRGYLGGFASADGAEPEEGTLDWYVERLQEAAGEGDLATGQQLWCSLQASGLAPTRRFMHTFLMCCHYGGGEPIEAQHAVRDMCATGSFEPDSTTTRLLAAIDIGWQQLHCL